MNSTKCGSNTNPHTMMPPLWSQATSTATAPRASAPRDPNLSHVRAGSMDGAPGGNSNHKLDRPNLAKSVSDSSSSQAACKNNFLPHAGVGVGPRKPSLKDVARRVQSIRTVMSDNIKRSRAHSTPSAADILEAIGGGGGGGADASATSDHVVDFSHFSTGQNPAVTQAFHHIAPLFEDEYLGRETEKDTVNDEEDEERPELIPVSVTLSSSSEPYYGSLPVSESKESLTQETKLVSFQRRHSKRSRWRKLQRQFCSPLYWIRSVSDCARHSWVLWVALPLAVAAWILYYLLGNPELEFLPGTARLSWWCNFFARQIVTLELARLTSLALCDMVMTRGVVRFLGSPIVFFCLQATGWPFLVMWWGIWDLLLLHGDKPFQSHWLHRTGWKIYSVADSGTYILSSDFYLRMLVSMIIMGVATAIKRVVLATRFGIAQLAEYKPKLEKILQDAVIVSEVALIAQEAAALSGEVSPRKDTSTNSEMGSLRPRVRLASVAFTDDDDEVAPNEGAVDSQFAAHTPTDSCASTTMTKASVVSQELDEASTTTEPFSTIQTSDNRPALARTSSGSFCIKDNLERWDEPPTDSVKTVKASTEDVLKFQRVLRSIDATYPFGEEFGPCATRDDCIESSRDIYWKLMFLSPQSSALPFETITLGAIDEDGKVDEAKYKAFYRVFRPDANNELSLAYFIQSIDTVFKSLLFFRASVRNSSVIDGVLEKIINGVFYFIMMLLLLCLMQLNPWPLLVSLTSLLVSVSFAMGSSVSKYVEGLSLIAFRRPFDLGDQIIALSPEATDDHTPLVRWIVEDINLFGTTLRSANTNEVATVSNSSIAGARIVNLNRSPLAIVSFQVRAKICVLDGDRLSNFVQALEQYVSENPRIWDSLVYCRKEIVDGDLEQVLFALAFRHRNSWQHAGRIMLDRGDLVAYVYKVAKDMGISYESLPSRSLLYEGGVLVQGQVQDYKSNLLNPLNIRSRAELDKTHLRGRSSHEVVDPMQS